MSTRPARKLLLYRSFVPETGAGSIERSIGHLLLDIQAILTLNDAIVASGVPASIYSV